MIVTSSTIMPRTKLKKFKELASMPDVLEMPEPETLGWLNIFKNDNPIILELACGHADYARNLAQLNPNKNYIGIDKKGERIWGAATKANEAQLKNIKFLRIHIEQIEQYFDANSISEIWITFPDPFAHKPRRRLTHTKFLEIYKKLLRPNGLVHFKTDDRELFDFTLEMLNTQSVHVYNCVYNVHNVKHNISELDITTYYERKHIEAGKEIYYVSFSFK